MNYKLTPAATIELAIAKLIEQDCQLEMPIFLTRPDSDQKYPCIRIEVLQCHELFPQSGVYKSNVQILLESKFDQSPDVHITNGMELLQTFYFDTPLQDRLTEMEENFTCYGAIPIMTSETILPEYNIYQTNLTFDFTFTPISDIPNLTEV